MDTALFDMYMKILKKELPVGESFDLLERKLIIGGRRASMFFVDGLTDGEKTQRILAYLLAVPAASLCGVTSAQKFIETTLPFLDASVIESKSAAPPENVTVVAAAPISRKSAGLPESSGALTSHGAESGGVPDSHSAEGGGGDAPAPQAGQAVPPPVTWKQAADCCSQAMTKLYAGLVPLLVEGLDRIIIMDCRDYPSRSVEEPDKEKTLRGAKDGFTENFMENVALIRRRIRDNNLIFKAYNVGSVSKADVAVVYLRNKADMNLIERLDSCLKDLAPEGEDGACGMGFARQDAKAVKTDETAQAVTDGQWSGMDFAGQDARADAADQNARADAADQGARTAAANQDARAAAAREVVRTARAGEASSSGEPHRTGAFWQRAARRGGRQVLSVADQSLLERLLEALGAANRLNPFPKVRYTQRPDIIAAHLAEGKAAIIVDNSPTVMLLPVSVFEFFQDVDDYYFPKLTGNYFRLIRIINFFVILFLTPVYLLLAEYEDFTPEILQFFVPVEDFAIPVFWQFILLEIAVDGLKLASLNTPTSLGMSLSVIGALILGEFSIDSGWFISQTILCMAVVALAAFTQPSIELSYAMKFGRILMLIGVQLFSIFGLIGALAIYLAVMAATNTISGRSYLYPLIPFNGEALKRLIFRTKS